MDKRNERGIDGETCMMRIGTACGSLPREAVDRHGAIKKGKTKGRTDERTDGWSLPPRESSRVEWDGAYGRCWLWDFFPFLF